MTMTAPLDITELPLAAMPRRGKTSLNATEARAHNTAATIPGGAAQPRTLSINTFLALAIAAVIVAAFVGFGGDAAANGPLVPASTTSEVTDTIEIYVVQPGDTLWGIATTVAVEGEDIRPLVDHLKDLAGGSSLDVGQRIVIDHATMRS